MIFKDISNFNNVSDYLPILNGCINADFVYISELEIHKNPYHSLPVRYRVHHKKLALPTPSIIRLSRFDHCRSKLGYFFSIIIFIFFSSCVFPYLYY